VAAFEGFEQKGGCHGGMGGMGDMDFQGQKTDAGNQRGRGATYGILLYRLVKAIGHFPAL